MKIFNSLYILGTEYKGLRSIPDGAVSYVEDFLHIMPETLAEISSKENVVYVLCKADPDELVQLPSHIDRVVFDVHNNYDTPRTDLLNVPEEVKHLIVHTQSMYERLKDQFHVAYIPMSIDLNRVQITATKNGKWVYLGNLNLRRISVYDEVRKVIPVDTISGGYFCDRAGLSLHESTEIASHYTYGVGVGRALLEMLAMGLKCIVAGRKYGGPILSLEDFQKHYAENCNSSVSTSSGDIKKDVELLTVSEYKVDSKLFDMRNYIQLYTSALFGTK